jgi:hypothetical protein
MVVDENNLFDEAIQRSRDAYPEMHSILQSYAAGHRRINDKLERTLRRVYEMDGYTGDRTAGSRAGKVDMTGHDTLGDGSDDEDAVEHMVDQVYAGVIRLNMNE